MSKSYYNSLSKKKKKIMPRTINTPIMKERKLTSKRNLLYLLFRETVARFDLYGFCYHLYNWYLLFEKKKFRWSFTPYNFFFSLANLWRNTAQRKHFLKKPLYLILSSRPQKLCDWAGAGISSFQLPDSNPYIVWKKVKRKMKKSNPTVGREGM